MFYLKVAQDHGLHFVEKFKKYICRDQLPVAISLVAAASQDSVEAKDKAGVNIIELKNFDKLT